MKKVLYIGLLFVFTLMSMHLQAQDPQFSQLYANPISLGPSFAGGTGGTRVSLSVRDQWPAIKDEYVSYLLSADQSFTKARSAVGMVLFNDVAGQGALKTFKYSLLYSYSFNISEQLNIRPGLQFTIANRRLNHRDLTLGDQLDFVENRTESIDTELDQSKSYLDVTYFDVASSVLISHERFWFGATADHLTNPNESLLGQTSRVPMKWNFYGGIKFKIKYNPKRSRKEDFFVTYQYKHQDNYNQALFGAYWLYHNVITGLWYRGIPVVKTYDTYVNNDALVIMAGFRYREMAFYYSYDFTVSRLVANSGGAHELTVTWTHIPKKTKKRWITIPCPTL